MHDHYVLIRIRLRWGVIRYHSVLTGDQNLTWDHHSLGTNELLALKNSATLWSTYITAANREKQVKLHHPQQQTLGRLIINQLINQSADQSISWMAPTQTLVLTFRLGILGVKRHS